MKTKITTSLFAFLIMSLLAFSQPLSKSTLPQILSSDQGKLKSVIYQDFSKMGLVERNRISYDYTYSDTLFTCIKKYLESGQWVNNSLQESYISDGNTYQIIEFKWDEQSNSWVIDRVIKYEYNEQCKVVKTRFYSGSSNLEYIISLELNDYGDTLKLFHRGYLDGDSTKVKTFHNHEYFYNPEGYVSKIAKEYGYDDSVYERKETIFEYDPVFNLIKETHFNDDLLYERIEYTYNDSNQLIELKWFYIDNDGLPWRISMEEYEYDDSGNMVFERFSTWIEDDSEFEISTEEFYTYDTNNELIEYVSKRNVKSEIVNSQKITYDHYNDFRVENRYDWDNEMWVEEYRIEKYFNENGDFILVKIYFPGTVGLDNNSKTTYQYNLDDFPSYLEVFSWGNSSWNKTGSINKSYYDDNKIKVSIVEEISKYGIITKDKYEYTYNDMGDTLEIVISKDYEIPDSKVFHYYFDYDYENLIIFKTYAQWTGYEWYRKERNVKYFNENNDLDSLITQIYSVGEWFDEMKYLYLYDIENRLVETIGLRFNFNNDVWDSISKTTLHYGEDNKLDSLAYYRFYSSEWNWDNTVYYDYSYDEHGYLTEMLLEKIHTSSITVQDYEKYIYEYFDPTDVRDVGTSNEALSVYPNPTTDNLNIMIKGYSGKDALVKIIDFFGNCLYISELNVSNTVEQYTIPTNGFSSGVYTCTFISENRTESVKVIVIK